jgi:hypothetical protein
VILITTSYHLNRSFILLSLALRGYPAEIVCLKAHPFGIEDEYTMKRIPYFQMLDRIEHFDIVFNYFKFMIDGTKIRNSNSIEHYLENLYDSVIKERLKKYEYR